MAANRAAMRAEVARISPADVAGYERFMAASGEIFRVAFQELGDKPFGHWTGMAGALPDLLRLGAWRSVYGLVSRHIRDERLRTVFSFHPLLVGGNPFTASAVYGLIAYLEREWGVHSAMGGTGELVRGLAGLVRGQGNVVRCDAEVGEILVEAGRTAGRGRATGVRLATGEALHADLVVSNADAAWTYARLIAPRHRRRWTDRRIRRARYSMSLFVWYFGTRRRYDDVAHHTILLGPRYRALLADIFKHHRAGRAISASTCTGRPRPTRRLAPPGHVTRSTCCPPCRTWPAAPIGRWRASATAQAIMPPRWRRTHAARA